MTHSHNPWHQVSTGKDAPNLVNGIIEISAGSRTKYELDKESGLLALDRVLHSAVYYPANYGFIPQTYCEDGDPLDILVLSQVQIVPMCLVQAIPIGVMNMVDGGEADDKIIAILKGDPSVQHLTDLSDLPTHLIDEMRVFFEDYKKLEGKKAVVIKAFDNRARAHSVIEQAIQDYQAKFSGRG